MAEMPSLYLLVWRNENGGALSVSSYDDLDLACEDYAEAEAGISVVAAAVVDLRRSKAMWAPFSIETAHGMWSRDKTEEARERRRTKAKLRKDQAP